MKYRDLLAFFKNRYYVCWTYPQKDRQSIIVPGIYFYYFTASIFPVQFMLIQHSWRTSGICRYTRLLYFLHPLKCLSNSAHPIALYPL